MSDARDDAATPAASPPALGYGVGGTAGWSAETKAVIVAAAVVSLLSLGTWGGSLWQYLQPRAFPRSSLILGKPLSLDFLRFVLTAVMHVAVIAGALTAPANPRLARRLLLAGALGVVALAVYQFAVFSIFQTGLTRPRRGPDQVVSMATDGARLVGMNLVHGLLAMMLARPGAGVGATAAQGWPAETALIIAAAAIDAAVDLANWGALLWVDLRPALFDTIGTGGWDTHGHVMVAARMVLYLATLAGAAAALLRRRPGLGRGLLLGAAVALLALSLYGYVRTTVSPPPGMPRYEGAEWLKSTFNSVAFQLTSAMMHALVIFALTRSHAKTHRA